MTRLILAPLLLLILWNALPASGEKLTLAACLARAAAGNRTLQVAAFDETLAAQNETLADSAYLPRVDLQGGYTAQLAEQKIQLTTTTVPTQNADYGFFSLTLNYTLYDFGRRDARSRQATLLREAAADRYRGHRQELFLQVVRGYYGLLQATKLLLAADDEVTSLTEHLRVARNLYDQGVVTRNDVLQAEVRLAGSRQRRLSAENEVAKGWLQLNYLTGEPAAYRAELEETPPESPAPPLPDGEAVMLRPDYRAQVKTVQAEELDVRENRQGFYPELFLKSGVEYVENSMAKEQAIYGATVGVRFNLFEGGATSARLRQALARRSQEEARLMALTEQFRLELALAERDAAVARERIGVTAAAIRQAEENLRINRDRYREQVGTATELLDAQTLLTQAKVDNATALYDHQVALARVRKARGEL